MNKKLIEDVINPNNSESIEKYNPWSIDDFEPTSFLLSTKKGDCIPEAHRLRKGNGLKGSVYWVDLHAGMIVSHAYYIPNEAELDKKALNQADNGYEGFPALTVGEVIENGRLINTKEQIKEVFGDFL